MGWHTGGMGIRTRLSSWRSRVGRDRDALWPLIACLAVLGILGAGLFASIKQWPEAAGGVVITVVTLHAAYGMRRIDR
ncbi:MAG: hypothetical protein QOI51_1142, partial [Nocardioidaceae bacterium]|nr:hypothetical protein [Nocardioidaceae bacterium]